jgi:hypothetical protein
MLAELEEELLCDFLIWFARKASLGTGWARRGIEVAIAV